MQYTVLGFFQNPSPGPAGSYPEFSKASLSGGGQPGFGPTSPASGGGGGGKGGMLDLFSIIFSCCNILTVKVISNRSCNTHRDIDVTDF